MRPPMQPWGRWAIFGSNPPKKLDEVQQAKLRKWNESAWKMTVYIAFTSLALWVCWGQVSPAPCACKPSAKPQGSASAGPERSRSRLPAPLRSGFRPKRLAVVPQHMP
jgi:hypothetical protein